MKSRLVLACVAALLAKTHGRISQADVYQVESLILEQIAEAVFSPQLNETTLALQTTVTFDPEHNTLESLTSRLGLPAVAEERNELSKLEVGFSTSSTTSDYTSTTTTSSSSSSTTKY